MNKPLIVTLRRTASLAVLAGALAASACPALAQTAAHPAPAYGAALQGPKKSVAVIDVSANGAFQAQYGSWTAGGGLAAMLETELAQTNRFHIADRSHLDSVLYEQKLGALGLNSAKTAKPGALTGAQFLVRAAVTDFTLTEKGGGFSIGGNFGGVLGGISPQSREGRVSIDFQVIDSTTGQVVDAFSVTRKIHSRSIALTASKSGVSVGGNRFSNTPLGAAAREAIVEASVRIARALDDQTWSARVAQVSGQSLYVNAGVGSGLRAGDALRIYRVVQTITDPVTGALLGSEKVEIGQATIAQVSEQYATATFQTHHAPAIGDVLTLGQR